MLDKFPFVLPVSFSSTSLCFTCWSISVLDTFRYGSLNFVKKEHLGQLKIRLSFTFFQCGCVIATLVAVEVIYAPDRPN